MVVGVDEWDPARCADHGEGGNLDSEATSPEGHGGVSRDELWGFCGLARGYEGMSARISNAGLRETLLERIKASTHWEGCANTHFYCAMLMALDELERLEKLIAEKRA